jgi:hypothetical protein
VLRCQAIQINGIKGNTITFTGTTIDEAATLSIADDTAIGFKGPYHFVCNNQMILMEII